MATKIFKENLDGKYDGVSPATLLPKGSVAGGKNMRKVGESGGWKPRKGVTLNNTTQISAHEVNSLHRFKHPRNGDYHFIAQINSLLYDATNDPPAAGTTFGASLGVTVGTTPGFSAMVGEKFCYADGSGIPIIWGGDTPLPLGFVVYDTSETAYIEYSRNVKDKRSGTKAIILEAAADKAYLITSERCEGFIANLGAGVNSNAVTMTINAWRAGAWTAVSNLSDGTADGGATLAIDGTVTWDRSTSDTMRIIAGIMGYCYEIGWSGALSGSVDLIGLTTKEDATSITNKWDGVYEWVAGARFYDASATEYQECLGKITNESTSQYIDVSEMQTDDFIYVKTLEPATAFGLGTPIGYTNTAIAKIDSLGYWDGDSFAEITTGLIDTTLDGAADTSISQTGVFSWNAAAVTPQKRTFQGDQIPGYWYRISVAAALSADTRIYMIVYAPFPEELSDCDGCVEFKDRLATWGDPEFPNRLRISANKRADCFAGADSVYTDAFGDMTAIRNTKNFYNELIVWKEKYVGLLEGFNPQTFGILKIADTIGLASSKTAQVIETGYPSMNRNEPLTIAIWQDTDGIYVLDGRKPRKVSGPIDNYFNPESGDCIAANQIESLDSFVDQNNNEYHLLLPSGKELVYNYITDEWYPEWARAVALTCGLSIKGTDNRNYTYGGCSTGYVFRLESDTADKSVGNADVAIDHYVLSRAISVGGEKGVALRFTLRQLWAELKARSSGTIVTTVYKDLATSGEVITTPEVMSMVNTGYALATPAQDTSIQRCSVFQVKFSLNEVDLEMEIYGFPYELEALGFMDK